MVDVASVGEAVGAANSLVLLARWVRRSVGGLLERGDDEVAPGDWPTRERAYREFMSSAVDVSESLQFVGRIRAMGRIADLLGAPMVMVWSWRLPPRFTRAIAALGHIAVTGDAEVRIAAGDVLLALSELAGIGGERRSRRSLRAFDEQVSVVNGLFAAYVEAARTDLRRKDVS